MNPAKSTIGKFRKSLVLVPVLMLVTALGFAAAQAPVWHSGDRWGTYYSGGYRLANDVWGRGPGPQIIWANSATNWGVWADHPTTAGDKSYPNVSRTIDLPLTSLHHVTSSFDVTIPRRGAYETAYDIWDSSMAHEVMLWMNVRGVAPAGSYRETVTVAGSTWRVWVGRIGSHSDVSLVRTMGTTSSRVDILAVLKSAAAKGWFGDSKARLGQVQFGWEIASSPGGEDFNVNRYSLDYS